MRTNTATNRSDVLAGWVKAIGRTLDAAGCDSAALLAEAGFDRECLDSATARCPLANTARLWEISVAATGDPAFGVKVASHIKHTTFHALSYGLCASSTLKEAFERLKRYCHVGSYAVEYEFFRCGIRLSLRDRNHCPSPLRVDRRAGGGAAAHVPLAARGATTRRDSLSYGGRDRRGSRTSSGFSVHR